MDAALVYLTSSTTNRQTLGNKRKRQKKAAFTMAKKGGRKGGEKNDGGLPKQHARLSVAAQQDFQKMLDAADLDGDGEIDLEELHIAMESQAFKWEHVWRHMGKLAGALGLIVFLCGAVAAGYPGEMEGSYYILPDTIHYQIGAFKSVYPLQAERGVGENTQQKTNSQAIAVVALMQQCEDLEFDMTDKCINSMLIRCGVKQGFAITGLICGLVGALTAWSRKSCFRKVSACTIATACLSWLVVFAVVVTFVKTEGFQAYFVNQLFGVGAAGCGFKGFGPAPQLVEFGASFRLYIWAFVGSLLGFVLKMLDILKGPSEHARNKVGPTTDAIIERMIEEGVEDANEDEYDSEGSDGDGGNHKPPSSPHPTKIPSFLPPTTASTGKPKTPMKPITTAKALEQNAQTTATGVGDLMAPRMTFGPPGLESKDSVRLSVDQPFPSVGAANVQPDFSVTRQGTSDA